MAPRTARSSVRSALANKVRSSRPAPGQKTDDEVVYLLVGRVNGDARFSIRGTAESSEHAGRGRSAPCRTKAAATAVGCGQRRGNGEIGANYLRDHHLRDPLAAADSKRRLAVIDQDHADLAAII